MKKLISILLLLALALSLAVSCQDDPAGDTPGQNTPSGDTPISPEPEKTKLATPTGLTVSDAGVIRWNAVENATSYLVKVGKTGAIVTETSYVANDIAKDFTYTVVAKANGYLDSDAATGNFVVKIPDAPTIAISGSASVRSGNSIQLSANLTGVDDSVYWEIVEGGEYAQIDAATGLLTAKSGSGDKIILVRASAANDPGISAEKPFTVTAPPVLTQEMLDRLVEGNKFAFSGFVTIDVYEIKDMLNKKFSYYSTYTTVVKTAMDNTHWYAEYENGNTGLVQGIYCEDVGGYAATVGVDFMNEEDYTYTLDDNMQKIAWKDSGMCNGFGGLTVDDFTFNETTWRWEYTGYSDLDPMLEEKLRQQAETYANTHPGTNKDEYLKRLIADKKAELREDNSLLIDKRGQSIITSANPYDFEPTSLSLILDDEDGVIGIYATCKDDFTIVNGYLSLQYLTVAIDTGDHVKVPTIGKFTYEPEVHDPLKNAIEKMQGLKSYSLDYTNMAASIMTSSVDATGFLEVITEKDCYFKTFAKKKWLTGDDTPTWGKLEENYGFHQLDGCYNSYYVNKDGSCEGNRSYQGSVDLAKPTFAFDAAIFTSYYEDKEANTITYYVNDLMSGVASTFYYGLGNDIALYGIFATEGYLTSTNSFTPYVTVDLESGYITESGFYYYLGYLYGVIEIKYGDFDETEKLEAMLPAGVTGEKAFIERKTPATWADLTVEIDFNYDSEASDDTVIAAAHQELFDYFVSLGKTVTKEQIDAVEIVLTHVPMQKTDAAGNVIRTYTGIYDVAARADQFFALYFGSDLAAFVPFFGDAIGDTYGFGMITTYTPNGYGQNVWPIDLYYDVPLDVDYTIDSTLETLKQFMLANENFTYDAVHDIFSCGSLRIAIVDSSLDLMIYVWSVSESQI